MKKTILLSVTFLLFHSFVFSQDYLEKIVLKSCECSDSISDTLSTDQYNLKIGVCMINSAAPYAKQLKKDHGIDFDNLSIDGEKLGNLIGTKMATSCPDILLKINDQMQKKEPNKSAKLTFEGTVTNIDDNKFIEFSVKDNTGKTIKFYWFTFIKSTTDLIDNYSQLQDKNIKIAYVTQEFFDARIKEYRKFNIVTELDLVKNE
ncbi:hypothetical protein QVZ41_09400 [Wenyingzhuangia sp. chi5]|uniref:Uncharacterized protein n=1 Tax=Wenyingzhuangia gilva TaxID=3057677 RepID=A0ABT8VSZ0_9FLAO|nr:hypothetical protein [Wenyingzhuangia sp. chi5]MDO3695057.1 hypothetical protein [Wenyingzhuangia sp. chi5]